MTFPFIRSSRSTPPALRTTPFFMASSEACSTDSGSTYAKLFMAFSPFFRWRSDGNRLAGLVSTQRRQHLVGGHGQGAQADPDGVEHGVADGGGGGNVGWLAHPHHPAVVAGVGDAEGHRGDLWHLLGPGDLVHHQVA